MSYVQAEFTRTSLAATEKAWHKDLASAPNVFPEDVTKALTFAKENTNYDVEGVRSFAYGIFADGHQVADAILYVIISKCGRNLVKMLDCHVRPSITEKAYNGEFSSIDKLIDIYGASIVGTVGLGNHHCASAIKVYGRTENLLVVLTSVAKLINGSGQGPISATIEGRWLVVKPAKVGVKK